MVVVCSWHACILLMLIVQPLLQLQLHWIVAIIWYQNTQVHLSTWWLPLYVPGASRAPSLAHTRRHGTSLPLSTYLFAYCSPHPHFHFVWQIRHHILSADDCNLIPPPLSCNREVSTTAGGSMPIQGTSSPWRWCHITAPNLPATTHLQKCQASSQHKNETSSSDLTRISNLLHSWGIV